jgi:hypothetical protein
VVVAKVVAVCCCSAGERTRMLLLLTFCILCLLSIFLHILILQREVYSQTLKPDKLDQRKYFYTNVVPKGYVKNQIV